MSTLNLTHRRRELLQAVADGRVVWKSRGSKPSHWNSDGVCAETVIGFDNSSVEEDK